MGSNSNRGKVRICGKAEIFEGKRTKCERIGKGKKICVIGEETREVSFLLLPLFESQVT